MRVAAGACRTDQAGVQTRSETRQVGGKAQGRGWWWGGLGEMDGAYFPEQTENDEGSGMPMRSVSVNNLHISIDSFE